MAKRRTFAAKFKADIVLAIISGRQSAAEICREHQINPQVISRWKTDFLANASQVFASDKQRN